MPYSFSPGFGSKEAVIRWPPPSYMHEVLEDVAAPKQTIGSVLR